MFPSFLGHDNGGTTDDRWWGSTPVSISHIPTDPYHSDISTKDTIDRMIQITLHSATSPVIQSAITYCQRIAANSTESSSNHEMSLIRCLYWWVKRRVRFAEDEDTVKSHLMQLGYTDEMLNSATGSMDLLISPEVLLSMPTPTGDCDDYSMLLASMLVTCGFRVSFVTIAADANQPERFSHVYVGVTSSDGRFTTLDASHGSYPGWEANHYFRKAIWNIN